MDRRRTSATGIARGLAAFVLALFALGWIADRAHVAFETHDYCAEHGRVEHATDAGHAHAADASRAHAGPTFEAAQGPSAAHEVCCVLLGRGGDPVAVAPAPVSIALVPPGASACAPLDLDVDAHEPVPLLALAPKQSPPRA